MNKLLSLIFVVLGIMLFFLGSGFFKFKDPNWTDKGAAGTAYVASLLCIIYGIMGLTTSKD